MIKVVKVDNESEYGYSIELLWNIIRFGMFICNAPNSILMLSGVWKINCTLEIIIAD